MPAVRTLCANQTILVIEDDPGHAELIIRGLSNVARAETIRHLSDGEKAIRFLFPDQPSPVEGQLPIGLILLDLRLPRVDGLEVLKRIKQNPAYRLIPVVILSTSADHNDIHSAYENFANSYLVKPTDFDQFNAMLSDVHNYWMDWNQRAIN